MKIETISPHPAAADELDGNMCIADGRGVAIGSLIDDGRNRRGGTGDEQRK